MSRRGAPHHLLRVDWPECKGRGLCAELLPERIHLDEWGYPVIEGDIPPDLEILAREATAACPMHALRMVRKPD